MNSPGYDRVHPSTPKSFGGFLRDSSSPFRVPPTPNMTKIGYGTGVSVYHYERSPRLGQDRSPWVIKKRNAKMQRAYITDRLLREAEILRSLSHPNIVGFRGLTKSANGSEALVMEECSQSLGDFIENFAKTYEQFPVKTILDVTYSVCSALDYLHVEKRLIHGDMKSYNILIKGNFESIKLCDFGVSLSLGEDGLATDEYIGSLPWTAPEALADGPITPAVDIFAFGLTLYEMITLRTPHTLVFDDSFLDKTMDSDMMEASMEEPPYGTRPEIPELGPEYSGVTTLFNACTEENPACRPTPAAIIAKLPALFPPC